MTQAHYAISSVLGQSVRPAVVYVHDETLAKARNSGLAAVQTEWTVFLDADDRLDLYFIEKMLAAAGDADLVQPMTRGMYADGTVDHDAVFIGPHSSILEGNWLVISTMARTSVVRAAGGFRELPILEDWDLWIRCIRGGAKIGRAPGAVLQVAVNESSRNSRQDDDRLHHEVYRQIQREYR